MPKTNIEYVEHTWKIIQGCLHKCPYCYAKRFDPNWLVPRFNDKVWYEPLHRKKDTTYFVANTGDAFGDWVPDQWINNIFDIVDRCPQHTFLFLTKNPKRYEQFKNRLKQNCWVGTSVEDHNYLHRIDYIRNIDTAGVRFVSFEPILGIIYPNTLNLANIDWCIVGAESQGKADNPKNEELSKEYADPLIRTIVDAGVPLFTKPNLRWFPEYKMMPAIYYKRAQPELL